MDSDNLERTYPNEPSSGNKTYNKVTNFSSVFKNLCIGILPNLQDPALSCNPQGLPTLSGLYFRRWLPNTSEQIHDLVLTQSKAPVHVCVLSLYKKPESAETWQNEPFFHTYTRSPSLNIKHTTLFSRPFPVDSLSTEAWFCSLSLFCVSCWPKPRNLCVPSPNYHWYPHLVISSTSQTQHVSN